MKVLIIGFTKISYMPYLNFYTEQLEKKNSEVHLLYWARDDKPDIDKPEGIISYKYNRNQEDSVPLKNKLTSFLGYRKFAKKILKNQKFDMIIVLHSTPGVLLYDLLMKEYKKKYILDYRDFTYEYIKLYKKIIYKLVNNSVATFVSSDAFRTHLPTKEDMYTSHNILMDSVKNRDLRILKSRDTSPIRIRYWGLIRHVDININLINKLANDERFELHYHGREQKTGQLLKMHCKENRIKNVFFHGEYMPMERYAFIKNTEIIHNIFSNDKTMKPAMSNKYYDGVNFYIPQLCNLNSFMGENIERNRVGKAIDPKSDFFADEVYEYYNSIDWSEFNNNCDRTLTNILKQYNAGVDSFSRIITSKEISGEYTDNLEEI